MKIFGIGLSKTGTSSLASALEILGCRTKDYLGIETYACGDLNSIDRKVMAEYDAFTDTPIPSFYKELDREYPNSKFILTVRETNGWLKSCKKQFTQKLDDKQNEAHKELFMDLYGCSVFDEQLFKKGYKKFVDSVLDYFKDRPHDLLILDVTAGEGWEKLCLFLNKPIPDIAFPKANVTQIRWMNIQKVAAIAHLAGKELITAFYIMHGKQANNSKKKPRVLSLPYILARFRYAMSNNLKDTAAIRSYRIIRDGLKMLNTEVPIISPLNDSIPYSARRTWNHLWLIDPLENEEAFLNGDVNFTINIALVEDRKPIMGVVYAPLINIVYYGATGKGVFRGKFEEETQQLQPAETYCHDQFEPHCKKLSLACKHRDEERSYVSKALSMCLTADGKSGVIKTIESSMEWQTAAAHAVIDVLGKKVKDCDTARDLTYNKKSFVNGRINIV